MGAHDVDRTLPYATVQDDELRIPLSDLARFVLRETTPDQLLAAVIGDDDARAMWLEAVGRRYASPSLEDDDRRKLLSLLQAEVHDKALDAVVRSLETLERAAYSKMHSDAQRCQFRYWLTGIKRTLEDHPEALRALQEHHGLDTCWTETRDEAERYKLFGDDWNEAKRHWRERAEVHFQPPAQPLSESQERDDDIAY